MRVALARSGRGFASTCGSNRYAASQGGGFNACLSKALCWLLTLGGSVLFFVLLSVGLLAAYRFVTTYDFFALNAIEVRGVERLDYAEVTALADVQMGSNVLGISMNAVENRLVQNPWIEAVRVRRVLPGTMRIAVTERTPHFWVNHDGRLHYADEFGNLIAAVVADKFTSLPVLRIAGMTGDELALLPRIVHEIDAQDPPFSLSDAAWVRLTPGTGLEMYLDAEDRLLSVGLADWKENLTRLTLVMRDLDARGELGKVRSIRAQSEKVWVRREGGPAESAM